MTPQEYITLRKQLGRQWDLAVLLECNVKTIKRRELGQAPITEQDAVAIRNLVAAHVPTFEPPLLVKQADTVPRKQTNSALNDNILHWYVDPGYVLA